MIIQNALQRNIANARLDNPFISGNVGTNPIFPFQSTPVISGLLTMPNMMWPTYQLGLANFPLAVRPDDYSGVNEISAADTGATVQDAGLLEQAQRFGECSLLGINCPDKGGFFGNLFGTVNDITKRIGLISLALILVVMGLYFLVKSTETGQAAINLAKKI